MGTGAVIELPIILTIFLAATPAIIGLCVGLWLANKQNNYHWAVSPLLMSIGGIGGYLLMATLIYFVDRNNAQIFTPHFLVTLSMLAAFAVFYVARAIYRNVMSSPVPRLSNISLSTIFVCSVALAMIGHLVIQTSLPVIGWDALNWYVWNAQEFIELNKQSHTRLEPIEYRSDDYIQPVTITLIASFSGWIATFNATTVGAMLPWQFIWVLIGTLVFALVTLHSERPLPGVVAALVVVTMPLLENHALIGGYTELWLTAVVLSSASLITVGIASKSLPFIVFGLCFSFVPFTLRNSGFIYSICLWAALAHCLLRMKSARLYLAWIAVVSTICILMLMNGFNFYFLGDIYSVQHIGESTHLTLGGRSWVVVRASVLDVLANDFFAFFVNASFSTTFLALSLVCFNCITCGQIHKKLEKGAAPASFFISASVTIIVALMATQLYFPYGFDHATPGNDTGNSRFTLPAAALSIAACFLYALRLNDERGSPEAPVSLG